MRLASIRHALSQHPAYAQPAHFVKRSTKCIDPRIDTTEQLGFPPGREGTGFPGSCPVPSGNRDGTESFISRPVVPTGKGREGTGNAKICQEIKNYFKSNN